MERLNVWGNNMAQYAEGRRNKDNPTYETIRDAAYMYVIELGLRTAIKQKDEAALMELTKPSSRKDGLEKRARQAAAYVRPEVLDTINEAAAVAPNGQLRESWKAPQTTTPNTRSWSTTAPTRRGKTG